jgi:adenylosuccinate lyase
VSKQAAPIIHLGATSCFVKDNADLIIFKQALNLVKAKLLQCIKAMSKFVIEFKDLPTLGWTHLQPAQLTTVGKRAALWMQDLVYDIEHLDFVIDGLKLRGAKGTTGTQASFLELFKGDHAKVKKLDKLVAQKMGFDQVYDLTGQTYSRKVDYQILSTLSQIAQSASKFGTDLRLLMSIKEIEEPFEKSQIGSSAMAYKRNPMRCERMCGIARFVINLPANASMTQATQWLERTLDDSSNRRIVMSQAFLAIDSVINLYLNIASNLVVYRQVIAKNIRAELPFMATESIIMQGVQKGGDRQKLHEAIRQHSMKSAHVVKEEGLDCDLIDRLKSDELFAGLADKLDDILAPSNFIGRAAQQAEEYIGDIVKPLLSANKRLMEQASCFEIEK